MLRWRNASRTKRCVKKELEKISGGGVFRVILFPNRRRFATTDVPRARSAMTQKKLINMHRQHCLHHIRAISLLFHFCENVY